MTSPAATGRQSGHAREGRRLQHVVAHLVTGYDEGAFDEVLVFGQELDALRHIVGKAGWAYAAVSHGQPFVEALQAARS